MKKLFVLLLCLPVVANAWEMNEQFDVGNGGTLRFDADVGSVDISTHNSDSLNFQLEASGYDEDDLKVSFDQRGDDLVINVDRRKDFGWDWGSRRVKFTLVLPREYNLDVKTSGGSVFVTELEGTIDLRTSGGSIDVDEVVGNLDLRTSGGTVTIADVDGMAEMKTSGGSIRATDVTGNVEADTSGGSIRIKRAGGDIVAETSGGGISIVGATGRVDASTSGGSIDLELVEQPQGDAELSTSGGSITIEMASHVGMDLNARANRIRTDFPVNGETSAKKSLRGDLNGGGPELNVRASGGSILIRED